MQIVSIEVSYKEVCSLPGYSNVAIEQSLAVVVEQGEDAATAREQAFTNVKTFVQEQIDQTLEDNGQPPKYSTDPRFMVLQSASSHAVALIPVGKDRPPSEYMGTVSAINNLRYAAALKQARHFAEQRGYTVYDCADGDFSKLPKSEELPF